MERAFDCQNVSTDNIIIYSDGACSGNPGPGGWASVVLTPDLKVQELGGASPSTTNNRMEMTAALRGLQFVSERTENISVFTDSVYLIRGITQWVFGWQRRGWKTADGKDVTNQDLWQELMNTVLTIDRKRITWNFVRGHRGTPGNERCDVIAVAHSKGQMPALYKGPLGGYGLDLDVLPEPQALPDMKERTQKKIPFCYLSLVNGKLEQHTTWAECEARVKGRSGARFKKAMTPEEVAKIRSEWGV